MINKDDRTFESGVRKVKSSSASSRNSLRKIVDLHLKLLSSGSIFVAGVTATSLYEALSMSPEGIILLGERQFKPSAFAAGAINLRSSYSAILNHLGFWSFVVLLFSIVLKPTAVLARLALKKNIPKDNVGYIFTLAARPTEEIQNGVRGYEILKVLEHEFLLRDCRQVWVDIEKRNEKALAFFISNRYVLVERAFGHILLCKSI